MEAVYQNFLIRNWQPSDRTPVTNIIRSVLAEYHLDFEPRGADCDVVDVENYYLTTKGDFWVIQQDDQLVGTGGYYPVMRGEQAVEIRKMYLLPHVRGLGLGKYLLQQLEKAIAARGFKQIWIETASVLTTAVKLYESCGYQPASKVETPRCDRIYVKQLMKE
ncbi:GCN5-related N-acetyltransferase [Gloeocapsa sp. PCC 7428]|uniref:GNAT family N-acetyltransferase n=1 Tax=Gloeocapsa sp. PCC 7428 TaxID=1173026 RepID=UPI0002A5D51B|nr:GNAT family N-acetyltransferase [Gloeocapsa sp. PCC 7428]AFZ31005.1 GCN5-related N-acetyltransferase [Gloeocapsa sp. PCC 7428]